MVDAYTLTLTVVLLTAGSLGDIFGHKRLLAIGLVIFTVASLACAQAPTACSWTSPAGCRASARRSCSRLRSP